MKHEELRQLIREEIQTELFGLGNKKDKGATIERSLKVLEKGLGVLKKVDGGKLSNFADKMQEEIDNIRSVM